MPFIDADGTPINVEIEGKADAPVLVFSNSLGTNLHMWDEQAKALAGRFRVVRYDQRGHGKSGVPDGVYSIERLSRDVIAILDALEIRRAHFCGLSMGGMTGMWLACNAPDRLEKLVLANTAPRSQNPDLWNARIRTVRAKGVAALADTAINVWFTKEFREREPQKIAWVREMFSATPTQGYIGCCGGIRDMDQRWALSQIRLPTLIIAGRHDNATPLSASEFIASRIAGSELTVLDAAHISNVEQPARFTATLEEFLLQG
ncbi:MAG: 3-oxoadipate enol-lactonase [Bradyrhizobiaceae bacterium]|nr:3-oxoadipate enol-lactonase [Bradyrhizobiaceae bacterium]